jgi:hypothetical protein
MPQIAITNCVCLSRFRKERNDKEMKYFYCLEERRNYERNIMSSNYPIKDHSIRGKICERNKLAFVISNITPLTIF